jgi:hypothetical protein
MENRPKRKRAGDALTFRMGVNQARTPNIAMIAAGSDAIYVDLEHNPTSLRGARTDLERMRTIAVPRT